MKFEVPGVAVIRAVMLIPLEGGTSNKIRPAQVIGRPRMNARIFGNRLIAILLRTTSLEECWCVILTHSPLRQQPRGTYNHVLRQRQERSHFLRVDGT